MIENSSSIIDMYVVDPFRNYDKSETVRCRNQFVKNFSELRTFGPNGIIFFDVFSNSSHKGSIQESIDHIQNLKKNLKGLFIAMGQYGGNVLDDNRLLAVMKHVHGYIPAEAVIPYANNVLGGLTMLQGFNSEDPAEKTNISCEKMRQIILRLNYILLKRYFIKFPNSEFIELLVGIEGGIHLYPNGYDNDVRPPNTIPMVCHHNEIDDFSFSLN